MSNVRKEAPELSKEQTAGVKAALSESVSSAIRYLEDQGFSRGDIARSVSTFREKPVSYQHVKNVLDQRAAKAAKEAAAAEEAKATA